MKIIILLYDGFTALDVIGPYEVLARIPDPEIYFTGLSREDYSDTYGLKIHADYSIDEITGSDILFIPGGYGVDRILKNSTLINWIQEVDKTSKWTVSVCSGSLLLAEAGLLDNRDCTTHWMRREQLARYNVRVINERYVHDGKIITSAGVSAGIDMALYLAEQICGEQVAKMIQLGIEYDPKPPHDSGSPEKVPAEILNKFMNRK